MSFLKRLLLVIIILLVLFLSAIIVTGYRALAQAAAAQQNQDYRAATTAYARAAQLLFWRKDLYEAAAFNALKAQDFPTAIHYFKLAHLTERGQLSLAYAYYQSGDPASAQQAFEQGAQVYHAASFYAGLAVIFHAQKKWDEERRAVAEQVQLDAGNASAHYRLGVLLTLLQPDAALPELMRAAALDGQFDSAVQTLRAGLNISAAQRDPAQKMVTLGRALGLVQEWELALLAFQKSVGFDSQNAEAWAWLGEAKQQTGGSGRAELDQALKLAQGSAIVHGLNALYWDRQQNYKQALAEYWLAAETDAKNPVWQAAIGEEYAKTGDLVSALAAYQHATEFAPTEAKYWRLLAVFCADNGVSTEDIGLPAAQKAVQLAPDDPLALDALGYAYYSTGRYANAEKTLTDVSTRFPQQYSAQIHLAMNYLAQGNSAAAHQVLTHVRTADPHGADGELAARLLEKYFP